LGTSSPESLGNSNCIARYIALSVQGTYLYYDVAVRLQKLNSLALKAPVSSKSPSRNRFGYGKKDSLSQFTRKRNLLAVFLFFENFGRGPVTVRNEQRLYDIIRNPNIVYIRARQLFSNLLTMAGDEYIGVLLAVCSSALMGLSYVITKVGLRQASDKHGFSGDGFEYFKCPVWWIGMIMLVVGELFNFAAYAFAPAVLVTPLGALSVLTGTVLGAYFLKEILDVLGKLGCALCLLGSVLIVANAPPDKEIETVDQILNLATQPGIYYDSILKRGDITDLTRFLVLLLRRCDILDCHDLSNRS
jgi:uncharacterized membrane protein